jgi:hypothetical protein
LERQEKAIIRKATLEALKAKAIANKASKLASRASKGSIQATKGKRKLGESSLGVASTPVAKRVASKSTSGRPVITPARFL